MNRFYEPFVGVVAAVPVLAIEPVSWFFDWEPIHMLAIVGGALLSGWFSYLRKHHFFEAFFNIAFGLWFTYLGGLTLARHAMKILPEGLVIPDPLALGLIAFVAPMLVRPLTLVVTRYVEKLGGKKDGS